MRSWPETTSLPSQTPATELRESMSTQLTQSSCSKLASYNGGIKLRTYCKLRVVSEDNPFAVRYSSRVVRRKVPLMRKSKGIGAGVSSMDSEFRIWERPYRRTSTNHQSKLLMLVGFELYSLVGTRSCLFPSGSSMSAEFVIKWTWTCPCRLEDVPLSVIVISMLVL